MTEFSFTELAALLRIDANTTVENFGGRINATFFEGANLLGALKLKRFVTFQAQVGINPVSVSEEGKKVIEEATAEATKQPGTLEHAILETIAAGARAPERVAEKLSLSERTCAIALYRLSFHGYIEYRFKNARIELSLTERGFHELGEKWRTLTKEETPPKEPSSRPADTPPTRKITVKGATIDADDEPRGEGETLVHHEGPVLLDREKMRKSKQAYYIKKYLPYLIILILFLMFLFAWLLVKS